jgi:serine/threonine protein kinase
VAELLIYALQKRSFLAKRRRIGTSIENSMAVTSISTPRRDSAPHALPALSAPPPPHAAASSAAGPSAPPSWARAAATSASEPLDLEPSSCGHAARSCAVDGLTLAGSVEPSIAGAFDPTWDELSAAGLSSPHLAMTADDNPGILSLLAYGRRGPVSLGFNHGTPCAIKVYPRRFVRGPPPPAHPHVNRVHRRLRKGEQCVEVRQLCDGGEHFDHLVEMFEGGPPVAEAAAWFAQLVAAVAHCHAHGAVHGQMQPHHVLLRGGDSGGGELQVVGFSCCVPNGSACEGGSDAAATRDGDGASGLHEASCCATHAAAAGSSSAHPPGSAVGDVLVELRPWHPLEAPELHGRGWAHQHELLAADVWSLGVLLSFLLTGRPSTAVPSSDAPRPTTQRDTSPSANLPSAVDGLAIGAHAAHPQYSTASSCSSARASAHDSAPPSTFSSAHGSTSASAATSTATSAAGSGQPSAQPSPVINLHELRPAAHAGGVHLPLSAALLRLAGSLLNPRAELRPTAAQVASWLDGIVGDLVSDDREYDGDHESSSASHLASPLP